MPVFNGEPFLTEAVESALGQTLRNMELVAVDDGSRDGSRAVLERISRADHRVRLLRNDTNHGIASALNLGLRAARADYVAIAHADDVALPERLTRQAEFLDAHPAVAAVGSAVITISDAGIKGPVFRFPTDPRAIRAELRQQNCLAHPSTMLRRSSVAAVGGYRFDLVEDYDLWLRLSERFDLANIPEPLVLYRLHRSQLSKTGLEEMQRRGLGVRKAAQIRSLGNPDPLANLSALSPDAISTMGVVDREIARAVRAEWLSRAAILSELNGADAEILMAEASNALGRRAPHEIKAARELLRAEACLSAHSPLAGILHVARAFFREPRYATSRLVSWITARTRRRYTRR